MSIKTLIFALIGMTNLKADKRYYIRMLNSYNPFTVESDSEGYYLEFLGGNNKYLFSKTNWINFTKNK